MGLKVLMVCLGNICRSPMAEGILREKANSRNIKIEIDSAGTGGYHVGDPPDRRAIAKAKEKGIDISRLRARQFVQKDFKNFSHILVMDNSNYENVLSLASTKEDKEKVEMILNFIHPGEHIPVPDPYYGGDQGFEDVFSMLDKACDKFLEKHT